MHKFRFVCVNIRNISQKTTHCIALWHIQPLILSETNMNLLWYLKGTQLKTLRRENKSSETFTESGKKKASQTRCLTFAPYAWRRCIKMGIPSLNSAIFYNVSLYFLFTDPSLTLRMTWSRSGWHLNHADITNIPDPVHKNSPFHGQQAHFYVPIHENGHFRGQKKTAQSCLIKEEGAKLRQGFQINWIWLD